MPIIKRFIDSETVISDEIIKKKLFPKELLTDKRLNIDYLEMDRGKKFNINNSPNELSWIQVLDGKIKSNEIIFDKSKISFLSFDTKTKFKAETNTKLIISKVPNGKSFESGVFKDLKKKIFTVDWHKEPILNSVHDKRQRIYLITEALTKTTAVKGELIIYPTNTSAPEHFHKGAEHYQLIISGKIKAVLDGVEYILKPLDLVYNFENENHWFYNPFKTECHFVEFFVPGHSKTIWDPKAEVCTWTPTGSNFNGGVPSRNIGKHIHGEGKDI